MDHTVSMHIIGHMESGFSSKFGIPRQSGLVPELRSTIVFEPEYRDANAVRGLDGFSHIWVIWQFSEAVRDKWSPTVRPPRLGGNERVGVFATRSPFRPNAIGLSCVELESIEYSKNFGPLLHVRGADMMDGTPILDIKPYIAYADAFPEAKEGFTAENKDYCLRVEIREELSSLLPEVIQESLIGILSQDPRPQFQHDPCRIYSFEYSGFIIRFSVDEDTATVRDIQKI